MASLNKRIGLFGRLVIGKDQAAKERATIASGRRKFGPMVLGPEVQPGTNIPAAGSVPVANPSVSQLATILDKNPSYVSTYLEQELARPEKAVRPAALELFIAMAPKAYPKNPDFAAGIISRAQTFLKTGEDTAAVAKAPKTKRKAPPTMRGKVTK